MKIYKLIDNILKSGLAEYYLWIPDDAVSLCHTIHTDRESKFKTSQQKIKINKYAVMKQKLLYSFLSLLFCSSSFLYGQISDPWDGAAATSFAGGSGADNDPYLISNGGELAYLASIVNTGENTSGMHYRLTQSIDLDSVVWTPIGYWNLKSEQIRSFKGHFDGAGNSIHRLYLENREGSHGLFGYIDGASISNLGIAKNSSVSLSATNTAGYAVGGIAAYAYNSSFSHCYNMARISFLIPLNKGNHSYAGGIAGYVVNTTIANCYNTGYFRGWVYSPYTNHAYSGGIAGYTSGSTVTDCYNTATLSTEVSYAENKYSSVYSGGIVGNADATTIINSYNSGSIQTQSYASRSSSSNAASGGIVGWGGNNLTITGCYNSGGYISASVATLGATAASGGIIGWCNGALTAISNCYNVSSIEAHTSSTITNRGGISGRGSASYVTNSYYLATCGGGNTYGGTSKTEAEMKTQEFVHMLNTGGFSFMQDTEPFANNGYPVYNTAQVLLSFETNGGDPLEEMYFFQRSTYSALPVPTKAGYLFENWYFDPLFEQVIQLNEVIGNVSKTIYARWKSEITFNTRGGDFITPAEYLTDSAFLCSKNSGLPTPVRPDYTFAGWEDKNSNSIDDSSIVGASETLYAIWNINVSFDLRGGGHLEARVFRGNTPYDNPPNAGLPVPAKAGYVFTGWYYDLEYADQRYSSDFVPYKKDTLYAKWGSRILVHFNTNGGSHIPSREYYPRRAYNSSYTSEDISYNTGFPVNPTRENAVFAGWYKENEYYQTYASETVADESHTLYAKWNFKKSITLNTNGGDPLPPIENYTGYRYNATVYVNGVPYSNTFPSTPQKANAIFLGWYTGSDFYYQINTTDIVDETVHILYAKWGEKMTISFNTNGGNSIPSIENYTGKAYNESFNVSGQSYTNKFPANPVKTDAVFLGWYDSSDYINQITAPSIVESVHGTLYAKWGEKMTISFNTNGGSSILPIENYIGCRYNETVTVNGQSYTNKFPATPTKPGTYFLGWYDSPDYTVPINASNVVAPTHATLYAKWSELITVSFETYGAGTISSRIYHSDHNFNQSGINNGLPSDPAKANAYFLGWYDGSDYVNKVTNNTKVQSDHTMLYAKWSEQISIAFETYGGTSVPDKSYYSDYAFSYGSINSSLPADPVKGDARFLGWYDSDSFENRITNTSNVDRSISRLYARWGEKVTTVFIDHRENRVQNKDYYTNLSYDSSPNTNLPIPVSPVNPIFLGWFAKIAGLKDLAQNEDIVANRHHTLYACWGVNVSFNTNGGTVINDKVYSTGMSYGAFPNEGLPETPVKEGYSFEGWYLEPAFTTRVTENSQVFNGSHTLYAKWKEPTTVLVTFITFDGDIIPPQYFQADGLKYNQSPNPGLPIPVHKEHEFLGWYSDNLFKTLVTNESIVLNAGHTLYALWKMTTSLDLEKEGDKVKVSIYPNPVKGILNIETTQIIKKIEIYDRKGVLMMRINDAISELNVYSLISGTYIIHITTDETTISRIFIKK